MRLTPRRIVMMRPEPGDSLKGLPRVLETTHQKAPAMTQVAPRMTTLALAIVSALGFLAPAAQAQSRAEVICSYAPSQSGLVAAISGAAGGAGATMNAVAAATGLTAVTHSSGAAILTGSSGYIAGTLGGAGLAPTIVTVGLIVGGSAVAVELVCVGINHPEQVARVQEISEEFATRFKAAMVSTKVATGQMIRAIGPATGSAALKVKGVAADVWDYVYAKGADVRTALGNWGSDAELDDPRSDPAATAAQN